MPVLARRWLIASMPLLLAAWPYPASATGEAVVTIDNFTFTPAELVVAPGTRVVWTNRDDIPHTVTGSARDVLIKSLPLDTDDSFAFTFTQPGRFGYFCSLHPHMQGTVLVQ